MAEATERSKVPSDLFGIHPLVYQHPSDSNYRAAVTTACNAIARRISALGALPAGLESDMTPPKPPQTFANLGEAKAALVAACKEATDIKVLSNKGLVFFGLDDSIISGAESADYLKLKRLRVILLDPQSRWIEGGLLALRKYESADVFRKELQASHDIGESAMKRFVAKLQLHKSGIKYHMSEPLFRMVMTDTMAFVSSYAESPSTQVRDLPVFAFTHEHGSLYWALKRNFNNLWHNNSRDGEFILDTIEPEISAGGIVIAEVDERVFVLLVQRDDGTWVIPKGHKEKSDGSLETTALREVEEETPLCQDSCRMTDVRSSAL